MDQQQPGRELLAIVAQMEADLDRDAVLLHEVQQRLGNLPHGSFSVEEHGRGYVLYAGRVSGNAEVAEQPVLAEHGLNLLYLSEPDMHWPAVRVFLESAPSDIRALSDLVGRQLLLLRGLCAELRKHATEEPK